MISTLWPWERVAPQQRTFLWLAIILISASGLIMGLALRPVLHGIGGGTPGGSTAATALVGGTPTTTPLPAATTPQKFDVTLDVPAPTAAGSTMTIVAHTTVSGAKKTAQGVVCQVSFTPAGGIPLPAAQTTDATGTATFAVDIPGTTPAGAYTVRVQATWGTGHISATWEVQAKIT